MNAISFLKEFGFTEYEAKVFNALWRNRQLESKKISRLSNVPLNKVYQTLNAFKKRGIIEEIPKNPKEYRLINPEKFLKDQTREQEERIKTLKEGIDALKERKEDPLIEVVSVTQGDAAWESRMLKEIERSREENLAFVSNWKASPKLIKATKEVIAKGGRVRIIGPKQGERKTIEKFRKIGAEIKTLHEEKINAKYSIFDSKIVRLNVDADTNDKESFITLWIESKDFAKILKENFEMAWNRM